MPTDPNIYIGGVQVERVNLVAAFGLDNTGTIDCGPKATAAYASLQGSGQAAWYPNGNYLFNTRSVLPVGGEIILAGSPQASLIANLPVLPVDNNNAIIDAPYSTLPYAQTLTANVVVGSSQFQVAVLPAIGSYVVLSSQASGQFKLQSYKVLNVAGTTVTTDRPIQVPFKIGDSADGITPTFNVHIFGNGMRLSGNATRLLEILVGWYCHVEDVILDGGTGGVSDRLMSMDEAGYSNVVERVRGNGGNITTIGASVESSENVTYRECNMIQCGNGFVDQDGIDCLYDHNSATANSGPGMIFDSASNFTDQTGGTGGEVRGGNYLANAIGIAINNHQDFDINGARASYNTTDGIGFGTIVNCTGGTIRGNKTIGNGSRGLFTSANAVETQILGHTATGNVTGWQDAGVGNAADKACNWTGNTNGMILQGTGATAGGDITGNTNVGIEATAPCSLIGVRCRSGCPSGALLLVSGAGIVKLTDFDFVSAAASWIGINIAGATTKLYATQGHIGAGAASATLILHQQGILYLDHVRGDGTTSGTTGVEVLTGATFRGGSGNDFKTFGGNAYFFQSGTAYSNLGTATGNGASPVSVAFADMSAPVNEAATGPFLGGDYVTMSGATTTAVAATDIVITNAVGFSFLGTIAQAYAFRIEG